MRKRHVVAPLLLLAAFSATTYAKKPNPEGNWQAVENLMVGTPISVKARGSVHLLCYFERATEHTLVCQPLRPAVPLLAPWPYPAPFPYPLPSRPQEYVFKREQIQEVRLEHSEAANSVIGMGIGGAAGAALGAVRVTSARGGAALIFGLVGVFVGGALGRTSPLFHRKVVYRR